MKFVVPLTMPCSRSTWAAESDSCRTRMTGTTPATAASKRSCTSRSRASAHSSSPWWASSCLLAVTTWRPARMASMTYWRAGSRPPISSTMRSEASRISRKSPRERVSTPEISGRSPVTRSTSPARSTTRPANAAPTVPWPSRPTLKEVTGQQVVVALAPHDGAPPPTGGEDDGRARDPVVVVGHRVAVGARARDGDEVAGPRVVEGDVSDDHVARLAVLADQATGRVAAEAPDHLGLVAGAVEHGAQVVGHPTVGGHPAPGAVLDRLDLVEGHAGVGHERPAGLDEQPLAPAQLGVGGRGERPDVLRHRRRVLVLAVGHAEAASQVVGREVSQRGQRGDGAAQRVEVEDLKAELRVALSRGDGRVGGAGHVRGDAQQHGLRPGGIGLLEQALEVVEPVDDHRPD